MLKLKQNYFLMGLLVLSSNILNAQENNIIKYTPYPKMTPIKFQKLNTIVFSDSKKTTDILPGFTPQPTLTPSIPIVTPVVIEKPPVPIVTPIIIPTPLYSSSVPTIESILSSTPIPPKSETKSEDELKDTTIHKEIEKITSTPIRKEEIAQSTPKPTKTPQPTPKITPKPTEKEVTRDFNKDWGTSYEKAYLDARKSGKKILVFIGFEQCQPCKELKMDIQSLYLGRYEKAYIDSQTNSQYQKYFRQYAASPTLLLINATNSRIEKKIVGYQHSNYRQLANLINQR